MSIIDTLRAHVVVARKTHDASKVTLLSTLLAEIVNKGKSDGNRETTDAEATKIISRFVTNAKDTLAAQRQRGQLDALSQIEREISTYESYLPPPIQPLSDAELQARIAAIVGEGATSIREVMAALQQHCAGAYDGKVASSIAKTALG